MNISTRGRYGLRALLEIAARPDEEPVTIRENEAAITLVARFFLFFWGRLILRDMPVKFRCGVGKLWKNWR